jgi:hypothetical protein
MEESAVYEEVVARYIINSGTSTSSVCFGANDLMISCRGRMESCCHDKDLHFLLSLLSRLHTVHIIIRHSSNGDSDQRQRYQSSNRTP